MNTFTEGTKLLWEDERYVVVATLADGSLTLRHLSSEHMQTFSYEMLTAELFAGTLQFERATTKAAAASPPTDSVFRQLTDCTLRQEATARFRHWVIQPLVTSSVRSRAVVETRIQEIREAIAAGQLPVSLAELPLPRTSLSMPTVYRWLQQYEQAGGDIRVLIPHWQQRGRQAKQDPDVTTIIEESTQELYLQRERHTVDDVYLEAKLRVEEANDDRSEADRLKMPSRSTVYRQVRSLESRKVLQSRIGRRAARRALTQYGAMEAPDQPLRRVEVDHTPIDLIVVDAADGLPLGRPTLTSVLDVATRYPLGYYLGFEPPSYLAVCEALAHAFKPKGDVRTQCGTVHDWIAYGLPYTLVVDNAKEFRANSLEDACLSLGIELQYSPVAQPHFRGSIERLFRTFNTGLFHTLSGTTFSDIFQRGDYDALRLAKLTLNDLDQALHVFLLDFYAEKFHEGLHGIPARRWEQALADGFYPRLPTDVSDIDILLGHTVERTLFHYGVEVDGLRYNSDALSTVRARLNNHKRVKVKIHPGDIGTAHIFDRELNKYIAVPAVDQQYAVGLSRWKHRVIRAFLRQERGRVNPSELGWAKRKIRAIVTEAKTRQKKVRSRKRVARWEERTTPSSSTPSEAEPQALGGLSDVQLTFSPEELESDGWRISRHEPDT